MLLRQGRLVYVELTHAVSLCSAGPVACADQRSDRGPDGPAHTQPHDGEQTDGDMVHALPFPRLGLGGGAALSCVDSPSDACTLHPISFCA